MSKAPIDRPQTFQIGTQRDSSHPDTVSADAVAVTREWLSTADNRKQLRRLISGIIHAQAATDETHEDTSDEEAESDEEDIETQSETKSSATQTAGPDIEIPQHILEDPKNGYLHGFFMENDVFEQITRHSQKRYKGYSVYYEFDSGYMRIRTVPSQTHEMVTEFVKVDFLKFVNSSTARGQAEPMISLGGAANVPVICSAPLTIKTTSGVSDEHLMEQRGPTPRSALASSPFLQDDGKSACRTNIITLLSALKLRIGTKHRLALSMMVVASASIQQPRSEVLWESRFGRAHSSVSGRGEVQQEEGCR